MTTIEWLVIAALVLIAAKYAIDYWGGIFNPVKEKAETMGSEFNESLNKLSVSSYQQSLYWQYPQGLLLEGLSVSSEHLKLCL